MRSFLRFFSPIRAWRDLRGFLASRKPHELLFAFPALVLTLLVLVGFYKDSHFERPYKRNIIYVESWPLTRSHDDIVAKRRIDEAKKAIERAKQEKREDERRRQFQAIENSLEAWGI